MLGREVFEYDKAGISAGIIKHNLPFGKNYLYIPHGPVVDFNQMSGGFKNPFKNFINYLKQLGRENRSIFVKSEPLTDNVAQGLVEAGFKKSKKEIQPSKTVIVDLKEEESDILGRMHHKTRYNIQVAERHKVGVSESGDINAFLKLLAKTAKRDKFSAHEPEYYRKFLNSEILHSGGLETKLFIAEHEGRPVAAAIILKYGDAGFYLHGASDYDARAMMAPYKLHWHIIQRLKQDGVVAYDLWGIDARKWPGVTRFKLGWGGHTIEHPGSFDLTISRFWHLIYKIACRLF